MKKSASVILLVMISVQVFSLKPKKEYIYLPEQFSLIYKDLSVKTEDNYFIKAWFFPAQNLPTNEEIKAAFNNPIKKEYKAKSIGKPTIIICNGDAGNMSYHLTSFVLNLIDKNFNVVLFDWRGFGQSSDFNIETDYLFHNEFLIDYNAVVNTVANLPEVDKENIILFGYSTGAYLSFITAYQNKNVKCFIGRALLTSFNEVLSILKEIKPERNLVIPADFDKNLEPISIAPKFHKPTYLIVGEKDDRTPVWMSQKIFDLLPAEKELWIVPGASHGGADGPEFIDFDRFIQHVTLFCKNNLIK